MTCGILELSEEEQFILKHFHMVKGLLSIPATFNLKAENGIRVAINEETGTHLLYGITLPTTRLHRATSNTASSIAP